MYAHPSRSTRRLDPRTFRGVAGLAIAVLLSCPIGADAQSLGVGARFALVRPDSTLDTAANRYSGGQLRAGLSPRTALELAIDWRTRTNVALTERTREYPFQASLLMYPVRAPLAPYLLGGAGWYTQRVQTLDHGTVTDSETTRRFGYHGGIGGELRIGRHGALHADYRYTFIRFGSNNTNAPAGAVPTSSIGPDRLKLSHEGSMWTAGFTVYF